MWAPLLGSGVLGWGTRLWVETPRLSGGTFIAEISLVSQLLLMVVGPGLFVSLPFLPVSMRFLLYILGFKASLQLVFS